MRQRKRRARGPPSLSLRPSRLLKFEKPQPKGLRRCRLWLSRTKIATIAALLLDERRRSKSLKIEFQQPARGRPLPDVPAQADADLVLPGVAQRRRAVLRRRQDGDEGGCCDRGAAAAHVEGAIADVERP